MTDICIIGVGNVGGALALALSKANYSISQAVVRSSPKGRRVKRMLPSGTDIVVLDRLDQIEADIIFITTQDPHIATVVERISTLVRKGQTVFHTSGALSSEILDVLAEKGCQVGSIHPLTAISDPVRGSDQFDGAFFCVEGSPKAVQLGRRLVRNLGGRPFEIRTELKPLYHAAAVTSAGHITALFDAAVEILSQCGLNRAESSKILFPLALSTINNLEHQKPEKALTGTFARLDMETFNLHMKLLLENTTSDLVELFLLLGERSLKMVVRRSGENSQTREFRRRISMAKEKSR